MSAQTVGLVGIGMMGAPMAGCLKKAGYDVVLCDADPARADAVAFEIGARAAQSLTALGEEARTIITMLPDSDVVQNVVIGGADNLADSMAPDSTIVEMTSGDPNKTIAIGEALKEKAIRLVDAPVSGGVRRARSGELTIMTGGDKGVLDEVEPILSAMGTTAHIGILGAGQAMKALNNLVSAGGFLIAVEALLIGKKFGLEPETIVDVLNSSTGMNNSTQKKFKQYVLSRKFDEAGFAIGHMSKDLGIALDIARSTKTPVPFSALCSHLWGSATAMLGPDADHTAIARMCETFASAELSLTNAAESEAGDGVGPGAAIAAARGPHQQS